MNHIGFLQNEQNQYHSDSVSNNEENYLQQSKIDTYKEEIESIRTKVAKMHHPILNDRIIYNFYKSSKFIEEKTLQKIHKFISWRNEIDIENININESAIKNYIVTRRLAWIQGRDKAGRPIIIMKAARHNPKEDPVDLIIKVSSYFLEKCFVNSEKFVIIVDYQNFGVSNLDYPLTKAGLDVLQNYFPERLKYAYLLNVPGVILAAWKIVKPWLEKETKKKIKFLDETEQLFQDFDKESIPIEFGGTSNYFPSDGTDGRELSVGLETLQEILD